MEFEEWLEGKTLAWALSVDTVVNMKSAWSASRAIMREEAASIADKHGYGGDSGECHSAANEIKELK